MSLRDLQAKHAQEMVRTDYTGEAATYRFKSGLPDREVLVVINREALGFLGPDPSDSVTIQQATAFIPYSDVNGVTAWAEGDSLVVPIRFGQPAVECRIAEELSSGAGGFTVRIVA